MIKKFFLQPFFKDTKANLLAALGLIMAAAQAVYFLLNIKSRDVKVPIRYSGYNASLNEKAPWAALYALLIFTLAVYFINVFISIKLYGLSKSTAMALLGLNIVVLAFSIVITRALLGLV